MNKQRIVLSLGALVGALLLSGCMAAMMPAMLLGHAAHHKSGVSHEPNPKSCECEKPAAKANAPVAPTGPAPEKPQSPPGHGPGH